jgi:hypothetical protein
MTVASDHRAIASRHTTSANKYLQAGKLFDYFAVPVQPIDSMGKVGAGFHRWALQHYRHFSLPQSSSASRFTAARAGFLNLSHVRERPEM